jgi:hypothetical protein
VARHSFRTQAAHCHLMSHGTGQINYMLCGLYARRININASDVRVFLAVEPS